jgi:alanine dehydrogenase
MMKFGIIKEGKTPPDERVPLAPEQCVEVQEKFPVKIQVQSSNVRRFKDEEYEQAGIEVVDDISDNEVLFGVKEVPIKDLIPNKTYFFFSHTIKKQPYNRDLLRALLDNNITMVDYETLTDKNGIRLIGFGRYAGIVGCYNGFYAYGMRTHTYKLKRAYLCEDRKEMEAELPKIQLPKNYKIVLTGGGRVAQGAIEILNKIGLKEVSPKEFLEQDFSQPVWTQLHVDDYVKRKDGKPFSKQDFYSHPEEFESNFMPYAKVADMYISCHYWDNKAPYIFTREDAKKPEFKIKTVADISCDINGPVACTIRPSTIKDPIYGYDPQTESETKYDNPTAITVMAVDNLPCELPKDASRDFGRELIDNILPNFFNGDPDKILERATICKNGKLTKYYTYLQNYADGKE